MSDSRVAQIHTLLQSAFQPSELDIRDDSALHAGHAGAASGGGHYHVRIRAIAFAEMRPLARHRAVYAAVDAMMGTDIHALSIDAAAPEPV